MATVYPVLHHPDSIDATRLASHYLVDADADVPVVAYLKDESPESKYVTWAMLERSRKPKLPHLKSKALSDLMLRADRPGWSPHYVCNGEREAIVLERYGDYLTSSDIMDGEILGIAHHYFKQDTLYVGVPHACYMIIGMAPEDISNDFLCAYDEAAAEGMQFYENIFKVENESLTEIIPVQPVPRGPEIRIIEERPVLWYTLPYRGDFGLLTHYLLTDLPARVPRHLHTESFSGRIVVEIPESCPKFTLGECQKLAELEIALNQIARDRGWLTTDLNCAVIRILFSQRRQASRGLSTDIIKMLPGV